MLREAQQGDDEALVGFISATQADVWRCCAHLAGTDAADDLTQEVYLRAWRAMRSFRGESSAKTWILTIARRTASEEQRRRARRWPLGGGQIESSQDPAGGVELAQLLGGLDPDRRIALVLTQLIGLSYEEAAQVCGCAVGTVRSRVARARRDLLAELNVDGQAGDQSS
jgi:RNA polymerase sigma-70 factor (ECF subfamily)